jgi:hypothetical protein
MTKTVPGKVSRLRFLLCRSLGLFARHSQLRLRGHADRDRAGAISGPQLLVAVLGAIWLYQVLAMKRFYRQGWVLALGKFVLVSTVYGTVFLLPAVGAVLAISLMDL